MLPKRNPRNRHQVKEKISTKEDEPYREIKEEREATLQKGMRDALSVFQVLSSSEDHSEWIYRSIEDGQEQK